VSDLIKRTWIRNGAFGLLVLVVSAGFGYFVSRGSYISQAQVQRLSAVPGTIQLGKIGLGISVHDKIDILNQSGQMVEIDKVVTSCGCTIASVSDVRLKPEGSIKLSYKVRESYEERSIDSKILVKWHTDAEPKLSHMLVVPVQGQFASEIEVVPRIIFHEMPAGDFQDEIQVRRNEPNAKYAMGDFKVTLDGKELSFTSSRMDNEVFKVTVKGRMEDFPYGTSRREMQITYAGSASEGYERGIPIILRRF